MEPAIEVKPSATNVTSDPRTSPLFCDPDADITFASSDGVLFKIYRKYIEATSAGLAAPPIVETDQQHVSLQEPSEVLEILFRFVHPPTEIEHYRQPNMRFGGQPELLFAVAEAAEKYIVFGAMNRPLEILNHSHKHGYEELADRVAPHTIGLPLAEVAAKLTCPGLLPRWLVYYDHWKELSLFTCKSIEVMVYGTCVSVIGWKAAFLDAFTKAKDNSRRLQIILPPHQKFHGAGQYPTRHKQIANECKRVNEQSVVVEVDPKFRRVERDLPPA
ncbi:hypothetical protein M413DRAFT_26623 [Hebeloma cylindrosporum]|uniref:BTB domain-containing protein n=1 Tax=Hebeloma cylindrosporum TaxID=76867 RepID=A0A0C3CEG9_HEBCY|nr:hypothetical protein M413DRAFT_26623 [Hebeloma cylindrosporum h7]